MDNLCLVGIMNGGVDIAHRIARKIGEIEGKPVEVGKLDITPCRDDGSKSTQDRSDIPFAIEGQSGWCWWTMSSTHLLQCPGRHRRLDEPGPPPEHSIGRVGGPGPPGAPLH